VQISVRRFICVEAECPRRIFAERLSGFAAAHARTTSRLTQTHRSVGCALGGEAGSRLTVHLAISTSPDTLLRRVKQLTESSAPPLRFVGLDDWAWRKGRRYGTIVVDLERSDVVDLLPDRSAETVKSWLNEHPGVEIVSRDRASAYAEAAAEAAPTAQQVADRWHLLKNLREAIERLFERQSAVVGEALKTVQTATQLPRSAAATDVADPEPTADSSCPQPPDNLGAATPHAATPEQVEQLSADPPSESAPESQRLQVQRARRQRRVERFEQVHTRHRQGYSLRGIARELGMSRNAVQRYLRLPKCPDWIPGRPRRSALDPHREWIEARLAEGPINVVQLHRQLTEQGFRGSYTSVREYITRRLEAAGKKRDRINAATAPPPPQPSAKQLSFEWVRRPEKRKPDEQMRIDAIRAGSDELAAALDLADEFAALIRKRSQGTLSDWLVQGEAASNPELRRFAEGIRRDEAAVLAAVTQRWSNGPVEGHINRLKTVKRQMYGRAGFVLLRARVINAA